MVKNKNLQMNKNGLENSAGMNVRRGPLAVEDARELLPKISPDDYKVWFEVACALKNIGASYELFRDWSENSEKFDEDECQKKWDELPDNPRAGLSKIREYAEKGTEAQVAYQEPPEEMVCQPDSFEERMQEAAWLILSLFKSNEHFELCMGEKNSEGKCYPARGKDLCSISESETLEELSSDEGLRLMLEDGSFGGYIGMNPAKIPDNFTGKGVRDDMISDHRIALLESDDLPIEKQWQLLIKMRLPVVAIIFSGKKSLHTLCRIDAGSDGELYAKRVSALYQYAENHGLKPDPSCKNPSRLTRCPGFMRDGKLQYIVSWGWGYDSWEAFEKAELKTSEKMPATENDSFEKRVNDLMVKYGSPFSQNAQGKVREINHSFFRSVYCTPVESSQSRRFVLGL